MSIATKPKSASQGGKVGFVSLGCPKALVDSERILTQLKVEGYDIVRSYDDADIVVVNTCGFIDSAVHRIAGCHRRSDRRKRQGHRHRLPGQEARTDPRRRTRACCRSAARRTTPR
jgi:tRNA A37 methylthiotransferase MiaB